MTFRAELHGVRKVPYFAGGHLFVDCFLYGEVANPIEKHVGQSPMGPGSLGVAYTIGYRPRQGPKEWSPVVEIPEGWIYLFEITSKSCQISLRYLDEASLEADHNYYIGGLEKGAALYFIPDPPSGSDSRMA